MPALQLGVHSGEIHVSIEEIFENNDLAFGAQLTDALLRNSGIYEKLFLRVACGVAIKDIRDARCNQVKLACCCPIDIRETRRDLIIEPF